MFKENTLKKDLAAGKITCGYAVMSRSPLIVEMLGYSGFDWLFIDTEHVPIYSDMTLENMIRAAEASEVVPIVRVKENREQYIRNALEAGAMGVVVPHVATKEDAERMVSYANFPPKGFDDARMVEIIKQIPPNRKRVIRRAEGYSVYSLHVQNVVQIIHEFLIL